jgi:hypothetical protein
MRDTLSCSRRKDKRSWRSNRKLAWNGENWTVSDMTGKTLWKGYAGTTTNVEGIDMVVSTFERPRWTQQGELTARYVCASSKTDGAVTLAQSSSGSWSWRGHGKCL